MIINFKHLKDVKINYLKHLRFTSFESIRGIIIMIGLKIFLKIMFQQNLMAIQIQTEQK